MVSEFHQHRSMVIPCYPMLCHVLQCYAMLFHHHHQNNWITTSCSPRTNSPPPAAPRCGIPATYYLLGRFLKNPLFSKNYPLFKSATYYYLNFSPFLSLSLSLILSLSLPVCFRYLYLSLYMTEWPEFSWTRFLNRAECSRTRTPSTWM